MASSDTTTSDDFLRNSITNSSIRSFASSDVFNDTEDNVLCKGELWKKRYVFWRHCLCTLTWENFRYTYVGLLRTARKKIPLSEITGFYVVRCAKRREKDLIVIENNVEPLVLRPRDRDDMKKWMDAFRRASTRRCYEVEEIPNDNNNQNNPFHLVKQKKLQKQLSSVGKQLFYKVASGRFGQIDDMHFPNENGDLTTERKSALTLRQEFGHQSHTISHTIDVVLTEKDFEKLTKHIPWRCHHRRHILLYKMTLHGASLTILYKFVKDKGPAILAIRTLKNEIIGAYTSTNWRTNKDGYYGTGETFPFRIIKGEVEVFKWSKGNYSIMASTDSYLLLGGENAAFVLNHDFSHGVSNVSTTFNNEVLCHSPFQCQEVEVWGFEGLLG